MKPLLDGTEEVMETKSKNIELLSSFCIKAKKEDSEFVDEFVCKLSSFISVDILVRLFCLISVLEAKHRHSLNT